MESNSDENQDPSQPANDAPEPHREKPESHRKESAREKVDKRIKNLMETLQHIAANPDEEDNPTSDLPAEASQLEATPEQADLTRDTSELPGEIRKVEAESEDEVTKPLRKRPTETGQVVAQPQADESTETTELSESHEQAQEEPPTETTEATEPAEGPVEREGQPELSTSEEALAEVRRSLIEEQTEEKTGFRAAISRLFRRKRKESEETPPTESALDEYRIPETPAPRKTFVPQEPAAEEPGEKQAAAPVQEEVKPEPTPPVNVPSWQTGQELLRPRDTPQEEEPAPPSHSILSSLRPDDQEPEVEEEPSKIREAALEDYVTAPEEDEQESHPTLLRRLRRSWRDMRPLEQRLLIGVLLIIAIAVVAGSGFLVIQGNPPPTPTPTPTLSTVPFPISVTLPGSLVFPLSTGFVQSDGTWNPTGPQWLQGTEICRWVSLPWSPQLEAVLRTLKADDEIKLSMSNYDSLVYKVKSIEQVPTGQIDTLAPKTPSLLVILSKQDSDTRWVVMAKP